MAEKNIYPRFNFCGDIVIPKRNNPWVKRDTYNNSEKISLNMGIKNGMNCVYVSAQGFKNDTIKTKNIDNEDIEIDWEDRFDKDTVDMVSSMRKYVVNLGERKEFITAWDMIEYLESALTGYAEPIVVAGIYKLRPGTGAYKDRIFEEFQIQNVYAAVDGKDTPHLTMNLDLYYDKNSIDRSEEKSEGKIFMNCYTPMWSSADAAQKMFPVSAVFNTSVLDMTKEKHKRIYDLKMRYLETKSKNPVHMNWAIGVVNGAEEKEFDESCLTDVQREFIEAGLNKLEDFKPRGNIYGEKVHELRLIKPLVKDEFKECMTAADSDMTAREFEDMIYSPSEDETVDDMVKSSYKKSAAKTVKPAKVEEEEDDGIDTLF